MQHPAYSPSGSKAYLNLHHHISGEPAYESQGLASSSRLSRIKESNGCPRLCLSRDVLRVLLVLLFMKHFRVIRLMHGGRKGKG